MVLSVEDIIEMREDTNEFGISGYQWFFNILENNYISKMNGTDRNTHILKDYDRKAQEFIIRQLLHINSDAAYELMKQMNISEPYVSDENEKYLIK
ncbi:hypothetical protein SDC9_116623 [bioreactor metagenome]|uniref:Uncharacterized protein n=1 Tax=bioreactor metagenome TaxID=1076179 RepID=A0A645BWP5_9ZZZZ